MYEKDISLVHISICLLEVYNQAQDDFHDGNYDCVFPAQSSPTFIGELNQHSPWQMRLQLSESKAMEWL